MNRSFTARLSRQTPKRMRDYMWATHRLFNESLAYLLKHYFWMQNLTDRDAGNDQKNRLRARYDERQLERLRLIYRDMMGLDLPKEKRAGRSQSAQAWMEPITFSSGSLGEGPGESSKNIQEGVKKAIREMRRENLWLFDRELALPASPNNGLHRGLFGTAARRILNFEQNEDTHRSKLKEAQEAFERWTGGQDREDSSDDVSDGRRTGWRRSVLLRAWEKHQSGERAAEIEEIGGLTWGDFEKAKAEFAAYERDRGETRAREHHQPFDESRIERINGGMTRGWRDIYERLMPPEAAEYPDRSAAEQIIKGYQRAEPRRVGDINLFLWLADKPHLWRFVETMRRYNDQLRKLAQFARPIQFRYPRHDRRPEWFSFSETSPGHMYTVVSLDPMVVEFSVFVPREDAPILKKVVKETPLSEDEARKLDEGIEWNSYQLSEERLAERREEIRAELERKKPGLIARSKLDSVHEWTDEVWRALMKGFFQSDPPLDLSRFERVMVRYHLATDVRLRRFVDKPQEEADLMGRVVVDGDERKKSRWQGSYRYWFGPLTERNGDLVDRRRLLRCMPLDIGGIRLEYRGRLGANADPLFTLSCELDETLENDEGKRVYPAPRHRIPKREGIGETGEENGGGTKKSKKPSRKARKMPVGLRVLCIDLGQRHVATGAVVEFVDDGNGHGILPEPMSPIAVEFMNVPGIALSHIQRHQDERRKKQRKACPRGIRGAYEIRGAHLPRGQEFARDLLDHLENLKDDRRKKSANVILSAALKHRVDYIVFENLKGYRPDVEFGRRVNTALMTWNRRELVEFVKMEAAPFGIWVWEYVAPHHTSRFCHRCGGVGHRFSHITSRHAAMDALAPEVSVVDSGGRPAVDARGGPVARRRWTPTARRVRGTPLGLIAGMRQAIDGGKQFCCTECELMVNADYNAAMNLARKLADEFPAYQRYGYSIEQKSWRVNGEALVGRTFWDRAKAIVQAKLNDRFRQPRETAPAGGWPKDFRPIDLAGR